MPQPELIGKPTPSFCLSCYFLGDNDSEVGPKQSQLKIFQVRFSSRELPPVYTSDDSSTLLYKLMLIYKKKFNKSNI